MSGQKTDKRLRGLSPEFLHQHGCSVCPLADARGLQHPKMLPSGSEKPTILMVGEAPSALEDQQGRHFAGKSGALLKQRIPDEWQDRIRWTNSINCRPPESRHPESVEIQCCISRLEQDVARTKPKAVFGFGYTPLAQIINPSSKYTSIALWRGRRVVTSIGGHPVWYYPMLKPLDVLKKRKYEPRNLDSYGCDEEFAFVLDLRKAFAEIDDLPNPVIHTIEQATANIELVYDINRVAELLEIVSNDPSTGLDIETNCLRPYSDGAKILTMGFSSKSATFAFPVDHSQATWTKLERKQLDVLIKRFLYEAKCRKIVHSLPFEMEWLAYFYGNGCLYYGRWECSLSQAYLLDGRKGGLSLDFLCLQYFGLNIKDISGLDRAQLDRSPLPQVLKYQGLDAKYHRLLYLVQAKRIKQEGLQEVYEHQLRRIPALVLAQMHGVPVDQKVVKRLKAKYQERADRAAEIIAEDESVIEFEHRKGKKFNPQSPPDVSYLIKNVLGLELDTTEKGELAHIENPIAQKIIDCRENNKIISTYIDPSDIDSEKTQIHPDGMLHPILSTSKVVTWRTSSDSPNIQNDPKRDEELKEVRGRVKSSDPEMVVVSIDYSGIQARNVAMESKDKKLVEAFWHNYDIHSVWRDTILKKYPKWIPKSKLNDKEAMDGYRYLAKNRFVFPTFFGAQSYNLSQGLSIPQNICEEIREEFFDEFRDIEKWHKRLYKSYYRDGFVTGLSGFRRYAPVASTEIVNSPIQGDESLIVMEAMEQLSELQDPRYQPMLMVHDDLTFLWPKKELEKRLEVVIPIMINTPFEWAKIVPLEVEVSAGPDWIAQKKIGKFASNKFDGVVQISRM